MNISSSDSSPGGNPAIERALDSFWETIPPLWSRLHEQIHLTAAVQFDISVEQFHVLRHIRLGVTSVSELAAAKRTSRPAVSQIVDTLVNKGLVSRRPNPDDRRIVRLELTSAGGELFQHIIQSARAWMRQPLEALSPDELHTVQQALILLKAAFDLTEKH